MTMHQPPGVRPLPHHEEHRQELLAAIRAEPARSLGRAGRPARVTARWLAPAAAAAAVLVLIAGAFALHAFTMPGSHSATRPARYQTQPAGSRTTAGQHHPAGRPSPAGGPQHTVTRSYQVTSAVSRLVVNDATGLVTVTGADTRGVSVTAVIRYDGSAPSITRDRSAATLTLGYSSCRDCGVAFRVTVPRDISVQVNEGTGGVTLADLGGDASVQAGTGSITASGLAGSRYEFRLSTGPVAAAFTAPPAQLTATVGVGSVTIQVPASATYRVSASSRLGAVTVTVPRAQHATHVITAQAATGAVTVRGDAAQP